jgi:hypothetical protein
MAIVFRRDPATKRSAVAMTAAWDVKKPYSRPTLDDASEVEMSTGLR